MDPYHETYCILFDLEGNLKKLGELYSRLPKGFIERIRYLSVVQSSITSNPESLGVLKDSDFFAHYTDDKLTAIVRKARKMVQVFVEVMELLFDEMTIQLQQVSELLETLDASPECDKMISVVSDVALTFAEIELELDMRRRVVDDLYQSVFPTLALYENFWSDKKDLDARCKHLADEIETQRMIWTNRSNFEGRVLSIVDELDIPPSQDVFTLLLTLKGNKVLEPTRKDLGTLSYEWLSKFVNLERLDVTSRVLSGSDISYVVPPLRRIFFDACRIYDGTPLVNLPGLEFIVFKQCRLEFPLHKLNISSSLQHIAFYNCKIGTYDLNFLSNCTLLKRFHIRDAFDTIDLQPLKNCHHLYEIDLRKSILRNSLSPRISTVDITEIVNLPKLRTVLVDPGTKLVINSDHLDENEFIDIQERWRGSNQGTLLWI